MFRLRFRNRDENPVVMIRPDVAEDVQSVRAWLRQHADGGWIQAHDDDRVACARRLLFQLHRRRTGAMSDDLDQPSEQMIRRAARIPLERKR